MYGDNIVYLKGSNAQMENARRLTPSDTAFPKIVTVA